MSKEFDTAFCRHNADDYTLMISMENHGLMVSSSPWKEYPGNFSTIDIRQMTPEKMIALADAIRSTAYDIDSMLEKPPTPDMEQVAKETTEAIEGLTIKP